MHDPTGVGIDQIRLKAGRTCLARSRWLGEDLPGVVLGVHDTPPALLAANPTLPELTYNILFRAGLWLETDVRGDCGVAHRVVPSDATALTHLTCVRIPGGEIPTCSRRSQHRVCSQPRQAPASAAETAWKSMPAALLTTCCCYRQSLPHAIGRCRSRDR